MHPILLRIGPVTLYSYGGMIALGFLAAVGFASRRARQIGLDPVQIQNLALVSLVFGILGARATYVALNWPTYRSDWLEIVRLDHGGLVFYGGFAAGLMAVLGWARWRSMPFWTTVDLLVPPLVLAHALGRVGCFLNGCCYGKPSSVPWAVAFPGEGIPRHPTQLYEAAFLLTLFFVLSKIASSVLSGPPRNDKKGVIASEAKQSRFKQGTLLFLYGLAYGLWRFAVEFLRGDNPTALFHLTVFQLASVPLVLLSGCLLLLRRRS